MEFVLILFFIQGPAVRNYVFEDKFVCKQVMEYNNSRLKDYGMYTACMPKSMFIKNYGEENLGEVIK